MKLRTTLVATALAAAPAMTLPGAPASAGGLARPTSISARGVGMGGAFGAIADDATAWHFNPAGAAWIDGTVAMFGGELIVAPREYVPVDAAGNRGATQSPKTPVAPLPSLGLVVRPDDGDVPTRAAFGVGLWNTHGGELEYEPFADPNTTALNSTREAVIELVAGAAYEISDILALGVAVRLGLGLFDVDASKMPETANAHGTGLGVGGTVGLMFRPVPALTVGLTYRSPLEIKTSGRGAVGEPATAVETDAVHRQHWPQAASLAVALQPIAALRVAAQLDWTAWSRYDALVIEFPGTDQRYPLDWDDTWTARFGVEYQVSARLAGRAGFYYDTSAVPDNTLERQYLDNEKMGFSVGASVGLGSRWRVDVGFDFVPGSVRVVPDNSATTSAWEAQRNKAPGEHSGQIYTTELAVAYRL